MPRSLSRLAADKLGFRPVGREWAERLPRLTGRFRRSAYENGLRIVGAVMALAVIVFVPAVEMSRGAWLVDLLNPFYFAVAIAMVVSAVLLVWPLGRSYVLENGELSCVSRRGRVLWREDLRGLEYVTCSSGGRKVMSLKWPERRRRIELFESLERALSASEVP